MEKRIPKPPASAPTNSETPSNIMELIGVSRENAILAAEAVKSIANRVSAESAASTAALAAITESIRPRQKTIDVEVTKFNEHGRPTCYRITVN